MQKSVGEFLDKFNLHTGVPTRYIDLVSEVGELGKELLKGTGYGKRTYEPASGTAEEIGDCLFSLLALCCELNIDSAEALDAAVSKYKSRFASKGDIGSGN